MGASGYKIAGVVMILFGMIIWSYLGVIAFGAIAVGVALLATPFIMELIPELIRDISHAAEPSWDGEVIYTDGGEFKIRYSLDSADRPWFVAKDICLATGTKAPKRSTPKWGGAPLKIHNGSCCFSEESVQAYLASLAIENHAASRLLTALRNNVFRKLEKQRDDKNDMVNIHSMDC